MRGSWLLVIILLVLTPVIAAYDDTQSECEAGGYDWFTGATTGFDDPCCGDGAFFEDLRQDLMATGTQHSCALLSNGSVSCWGRDIYGELDVPSTLSNIISISTKKWTNCVVLSNGSVSCWGKDQYGEGSPPPLDNAVNVSAGDDHSCALLSNGSVSCWGYDGNGQVSGGSGITNAVSVTATESTCSCASLSTGAVSCWGNNYLGKCAPPALSNAIAVCGGVDHSCALLSTGAVTCWGSDAEGQVSGASAIFNAVAISCSYDYSCALISDGSVDCWGYDSYSPNVVSGASAVSDAVGISCGLTHSCALLSNGSLSCWGTNDYGEIDGSLGVDLLGLEDFYNASHYCYNGSVYDNFDLFQIGCENFGFDWLTGDIFGNSTVQRCCGDDGLSEDFYNASSYCLDSVVYVDTDDLENACVAWGHDWFSGEAVFNNYTTVYLPGADVHYALDFGDVDSDGDLDIVSAGYNTDGFNVSFNDGSGTFTATPGLPLSDAPVDLMLGDLDGDADLDFVSVDGSTKSFNVSFNDGTGSFTSEPGGYFGRIVRCVDLADLDRDGDLDFVSGFYDGGFNVSLNDGSGGFTVYAGGVTTDQTWGIDVGLVDSDNFLDVVVPSVDGKFYVFLGDGVGGFDGGTSYPSGYYTTNVRLGDVDSDGDLDVVTCNDNDIRVFSNTDGVFSLIDTESGFAYCWGMELGDLDLDGDLDVMFAQWNDGVVSYSLNDGSGDFGSIQDFDMSSAVRQKALDLGDVDGDGDLDFVVSGIGNYLTVGFNEGINGTNGACCGDDLSEDFYNASSYCLDNIVYDDPDYLESACNAWYLDWFTGDIYGNSTVQHCCGDDGVDDDFYNDSVGTTDLFCINGLVSNQTIDFNQTICEDFGYDWINVTNSPISYLDFDDNTLSSGEYMDDKTDLCAVWVQGASPSWSSGKFNYAFDVPGDASSWAYSAGTDYCFSYDELTDGFSYSLWVKRDNSGVMDTVLSNPASGGVTEVFNEFEFGYLSNNSLFINLKNDDSIRLISSNTFTDTDAFHHLVVTYDYSIDEFKIYRDGVEEASGTFSGDWDPTVKGYSFGGFVTYNGFSVDDFRMYDYVLSETEIKALYHSSAYYGCCGDDESLDYFFNGTLNDTGFFCHEGVFTEQEIDVNDTLCEYYSYDWLIGSAGDYDKCCGDDGLLELFYNASHFCYQSIIYDDGDGDRDVCEGWDKTWFTGVTIGLNDPCCGDDVGEDFYNGSIGSTEFFCVDSSLINLPIDSSESACVAFGYDWFSGATGDYAQCCGDDRSLDDFGNYSFSCCCNGELVGDGVECDLDLDGNIDSVCVDGVLPEVFISSSTISESYVESDYSPQFLLRNTGNETICVENNGFTNVSLDYYADSSNPKCVEPGNSGLFVYHFGQFGCDELDSSFYPLFNLSYTTISGSQDHLLRNIGFRVTSPFDISEVEPDASGTIPVTVNDFSTFLLTLTNHGSESLTLEPSVTTSDDLVLLFSLGSEQFITSEFEDQSISLQPGTSTILSLKAVALSAGEKQFSLSFDNEGDCANISDSIVFRLNGLEEATGFFSFQQVPGIDLISVLTLILIASIIVYHNIKKP